MGSQVEPRGWTRQAVAGPQAEVLLPAPVKGGQAADSGACADAAENKGPWDRKRMGWRYTFTVSGPQRCRRDLRKERTLFCEDKRWKFGPGR